MGIFEILKAIAKGLLKEDDAAKKIAELGYPESVAKRIASGELPMDEASRMARAKEQGFNTKNRLLHGTDADIKAFDKEMRGSSTDARSANMATWFTDDPLTAGSYANYAAMDSKVKKLLDEADKAGNAGDWDKYDSLLRQAEELESSFMDTANRRRGQNIIPVYTKDDLAKVDMGGRSFDDYGTSDEIANRIAIEKSRGRAGVQFNELDDAAGLAYQPATHVAVPDNADIRSVNAAFDPEYKGSNILGALGNTAVGLTATGTLGNMLFGAESAEASPISMFAKRMKAIDDEIAKYDEIAEQYRGYLSNAEKASTGEILREVNPQYSKYYQELKQMKNTAPRRSETENIRAVNDIFKNKRKDLPSVAIGTGALGGMSPEEQLFAAPAQREPEMRAIGGDDTPSQADTREAAQTIAEVLLSGNAPELTSTKGAGETMMKIANNQPIGIMDALEVAGQVEPMQYPSLIGALYNYLRQK